MAETAESKQRMCLVAIDGSKHAEIAVKWFKDNIYKEGDHVLLVHAIDHRHSMAYGSVAMMPGNPEAIAQQFRGEEKKAEHVMVQYKQKCIDMGMPAEILKAYGEAGEAIVGVAHDKKADLIVCGCRGLGTIRRTIMGSVSDYVVHHSDVPVFICRHD